MTRVNLVDPDILTDQHIVAERLELTWVLKSAQRSLNGIRGLYVHPKFVLGTGHVSFFHDKLKYIKDRFYDITYEMKHRGMVTNHPWPDDSWVPYHMWKSYTPSEDDLYIIKQRIFERLMMKPAWYRYYGKPLDPFWIEETYGTD